MSSDNSQAALFSALSAVNGPQQVGPQPWHLPSLQGCLIRPSEAHVTASHILYLRWKEIVGKYFLRAKHYAESFGLSFTLMNSPGPST